MDFPFTGNHGPTGIINITTQLHKYEYARDPKQPIGVQQGQIVVILGQETNDTLLPYPQCLVNADCLRLVDPNIDRWKPRIIGFGAVAEGNLVLKGGHFSVQIAGAYTSSKTHNSLPGFAPVRVVIAVSPRDNKWYFDFEEMAKPSESFHFIRNISAQDEGELMDILRYYVNAYDARLAAPTPATQRTLNTAHFRFSRVLGLYFRNLEDSTYGKTITGGEEDTTKRVLLR